MATEYFNEINSNYALFYVDLMAKGAAPAKKGVTRAQQHPPILACHWSTF